MEVRKTPQFLERITQKFPRASRPIVIVEIGNDWLKILECNMASDSNFIAKASFTKLSQIKLSVSDTISRTFKDLKLNKNAVLLCMPRHLVTVRILELPSVDPKEIADMIELQIGKQTPYAKEEIIFSHGIVDSERDGYAKAILVIARRSLVKERLAALEKVGIDTGKVALSSEGVYHWFNATELPRMQTDYSHAIAVVDLDSNYSDFVALYKGKMSFTKNILIGANNLINERERYQEKFIEEIKRSMDVYSHENRGMRAVKLFLVGASKNIPDLAEILSARLDVPCQSLDVIRSIRMNDKIERILKDEAYKFISITPLAGLAMKYKALQFDLMPNEFRIKKRVEEKKRYLTITGILTIAIFTILTFLLFVHIYSKNTYKAQLEDRIAKIKNGAQDIDRMRRLINLGRECLDAKGDCLTMLSGLYEIIPKEIYLTSVDIERKKQLVIKGCAPAMSDVFKLVGGLENSRYFKNVKNTYATAKKDDSREYTDFEIICLYEER